MAGLVKSCEIGLKLVIMLGIPYVSVPLFRLNLSNTEL